MISLCFNSFIGLSIIFLSTDTNDTTSDYFMPMNALASLKSELRALRISNAGKAWMLKA